MTVQSVHSLRRSMSDIAGKDDLMAKSIQTALVVGAGDLAAGAREAGVILPPRSRVRNGVFRHMQLSLV